MDFKEYYDAQNQPILKEDVVQLIDALDEAVGEGDSVHEMLKNIVENSNLTEAQLLEIYDFIIEDTDPELLDEIIGSIAKVAARRTAKAIPKVAKAIGRGTVATAKAIGRGTVATAKSMKSFAHEVGQEHRKSKIASTQRRVQRAKIGVQKSKIKSAQMQAKKVGTKDPIAKAKHQIGIEKQKLKQHKLNAQIRKQQNKLKGM